MLAVAEDHAKAGDGSRELQVRRRRMERMPAVVQRHFQQLARLAVGVFVAELEGQQFAGFGGVGELARLLHSTPPNTTEGVPYSASAPEPTGDPKPTAYPFTTTKSADRSCTNSSVPRSLIFQPVRPRLPHRGVQLRSD